MAKTFNQMVTEAMAEVPVVNPTEAPSADARRSEDFSD